MGGDRDGDAGGIVVERVQGSPDDPGPRRRRGQKALREFLHQMHAAALNGDEGDGGDGGERHARNDGAHKGAVVRPVA